SRNYPTLGLAVSGAVAVSRGGAPEQLSKVDAGLATVTCIDYMRVSALQKHGAKRRALFRNSVQAIENQCISRTGFVVMTAIAKRMRWPDFVPDWSKSVLDNRVSNAFSM
ncbi:MAG: hypothetical protein IJ087_01910, partial [Eggerthellaceae bacterium]|nr:hypothetical protein [Eggerthellaceae bacterium]